MCSTALVGGSGYWPRMTLSGLCDRQNCGKHTLSEEAGLPSDPACSERRPVCTAPWSRYAVTSGYWSVDRKWSTVCD